MNGKSIDVATAYLHGYFEAKIEGFAESIHVPATELTERLGALFLGSKSRSPLGTEDSVPALRRRSSKAHKAPRPVAVASRTRRGASKQKSYWAKMSPTQRSAEVKRRREVHLKKKAA